MSDPGSRPEDIERDAWLAHALRHAPDAGSAPPAALRDAILREAAAKARPASAALSPGAPASASASGPLKRFWDWLARPPVAAGFASVMAATLAGLIWWNEPMDDAMPRAPSREAAPAAAPAAAPPAPSLSSSVPPAAARTAPLPERAPEPARAPAPAAVPTPPSPSRADAGDRAVARKAEVPRPAPQASPMPAARPPADLDTARAPATVAENARAEERKRSADAKPAEPAAVPPSPVVAAPAPPAAPPAPMAATAPAAPAPPETAAAPAAPKAAAPAPDMAARSFAGAPSPGVAADAGGAARQRRELSTAREEPPDSLRGLAEALRVQPQRWRWQHNGGAYRAITPAVQAWLSQLAATPMSDEAARVAGAVGRTGAMTELRLLRDGRQQIVIRLDDGRATWQRADASEPQTVLAIDPAAVQALRAALDDAAR